MTLWGVPGDPRHNEARGWECVAGGFFQSQIGKTCPNTNQPQPGAVPDAPHVLSGQPRPGTAGIDDGSGLVDKSRAVSLTNMPG